MCVDIVDAKKFASTFLLCGVNFLVKRAFDVVKSQNPPYNLLNVGGGVRRKSGKLGSLRT